MYKKEFLENRDLARIWAEQVDFQLSLVEYHEHCRGKMGLQRRKAEVEAVRYQLDRLKHYVAEMEAYIDLEETFEEGQTEE